MDGRVLSSEEGQEERTEENVKCNLSADGGQLLSTQEDDTDAQCKEKEREVLEHDQSHVQIPIQFVGNNTVEMVSMNDATSPIE